MPNHQRSQRFPQFPFATDHGYVAISTFKGAKTESTPKSVIGLSCMDGIQAHRTIVSLPNGMVAEAIPVRREPTMHHKPFYRYHRGSHHSHAVHAIPQRQTDVLRGKHDVDVLVFLCGTPS